MLIDRSKIIDTCKIKYECLIMSFSIPVECTLVP